MLLPVLALDVHPKDRILHVGLPSTDIILTILNTMLTGKQCDDNDNDNDIDLLTYQTARYEVYRLL